MTTMLLRTSALALMLAAGTAIAAEPKADDRVAALEAQVAKLERVATASADRNAVQNLFGRYMTLHNAFRDPEIVQLWAKKGTPGVRAQYSNNGVYTNWDNIMAYHAQRPNPPGKLIYHFIASPIIEVAEDGQTAKGMWLMSGLESGLTSPEAAKGADRKSVV